MTTTTRTFDAADPGSAVLQLAQDYHAVDGAIDDLSWACGFLAACEVVTSDPETAGRFAALLVGNFRHEAGAEARVAELNADWMLRRLRACIEAQDA